MTLRIAVVVGPDAGHAFPCMAIATALRDRGHAVTVVTGTQWELAVRRASFPFIELPLLAPTPRDADFGYRLWGRATEMAIPLRLALAPLGLDLIVSDVLTQAGVFVARMLDLPFVTVSPHYIQTAAPDVPPVGLGARPPRTPLGGYGHERVRTHQRLSEAAGRRMRDGCLARLGVDPEGHAAAAALYATVPALEYPRSNWPARAFTVGALEWEPTWPSVRVPEGDGPLVLVTDSTASTSSRPLVERALRGLARRSAARGLRVVATTREAYEGPRPANTVIGPGSHGQLMDAAAVVVGPGGHGSVTKSLVRGVPYVAVPEQGDQRETSMRLTRSGAGIAVRPGRPGAIATAVVKVLSDGRYTQAAQGIAKQSRGLGPNRAAEIIETAAEAASMRGDA